MNFIAGQGTLVFLSTGIGGGPTAPQLKYFDVYYIDPPEPGVDLGDEET